jgi:hypothetical protein
MCAVSIQLQLVILCHGHTIILVNNITCSIIFSEQCYSASGVEQVGIPVYKPDRQRLLSLTVHSLVSNNINKTGHKIYSRPLCFYAVCHVVLHIQDNCYEAWKIVVRPHSSRKYRVISACVSKEYCLVLSKFYHYILRRQ